MSVRLTEKDLKVAGAAAELLAAPLDHASEVAWRSAVNFQLKNLLNADSAGFLLPSVDGPFVYSEEHDPDELAKYPDLPPPPLSDGTPVFNRLLALGVANLEDVYGDELDTYLKSGYYNEYAGANGAHDTLAASVSAGDAGEGAIAGLQFWHERPHGRKFGDREVALLRLLYPSFKAGVDAQLRWGRHRADLLNTLDTLNQATLVCDATGTTLHQTPALAEALMADPEGSRVRQAMMRLSRAPCSTKEISTVFASYQLTAAKYPSPFSDNHPLILVALSRTTPVLRTEKELRSKYQLTATEFRVASVIARGSSNAEIARELCISPHTARRHTERIFLKLSARSRAEVAVKLLR